MGAEWPGSPFWRLEAISAPVLAPADRVDRLRAVAERLRVEMERTRERL